MNRLTGSLILILVLLTLATSPAPTTTPPAAVTHVVYVNVPVTVIVTATATVTTIEPTPTSTTTVPAKLPTQTPIVPTITPLATVTPSPSPVATTTPIATYHGRATWFSGDWNYMQRYYKGLAIDKPPSWEMLPANWHGYGLFAAMPESWGYHGRSVRVTYRSKVVWVQLLDVVRAGSDSKGFLSQGKVIDLGKETFQIFAPLSEGRLDNVEVEVF